MTEQPIDVPNNPSEDEVQKYMMLSPMLNSALEEMREFSKKKQDGLVSTTKIKLLNRLLTDVGQLLARQATKGYLDLLDDTELPQNSDVVLILGQYRASMDRFKEEYYLFCGGEHIWITMEWLEKGAEEEGEEEEENE